MVNFVCAILGSAGAIYAMHAITPATSVQIEAKNTLALSHCLQWSVVSRSTTILQSAVDRILSIEL